MKLQDRIRPNTIIKNQYGGYQRHSPRFIVGYWSIRGLAAPIRMLLSAAQIDHWVALYDVNEVAAGGWDKSAWLKDKEWLREEYPLINLPFLIDCAEQKVLSQTNAILSYLGRELKLLGTSKSETCQCEELLCEIMDLRNLMVRFAYQSDDSKILLDAKQLLKNAQPSLVKLERHLMQQYPDAEDRVVSDDELNTVGFYMNGICHLVGREFSAPDFHLWEMLDQYQGLCRNMGLPNCLGDATTCSEQVDEPGETPTDKTKVFPYLKEFHDNFINLFANQVYGDRYNLSAGTSQDAIHLPYNNPYARFGSDPQSLGRYQRGQKAPWKNRGVISKSYTRIGTGIEYWDDEALQAAGEKRKAAGLPH